MIRKFFPNCACPFCKMQRVLSATRRTTPFYSVVTRHHPIHITFGSMGKSTFILRRSITTFSFASETRKEFWEAARKAFEQLANKFGLVFGFVTIDYLYTQYAEEKRKLAIREALETGSRLPPAPPEMIPRRKYVDALKRAFTPDQPSSNCYFLIVGDHGTGKTTLVSTACKELGHGVLYVSVPNDVIDFGKQFGGAIGYHFDKRVSFTEAFRRRLLDIPIQEKPAPDETEPVSSIRRVLPVLKDAARDFAAKHKRAPVCIIDNVDTLAAASPKTLELLQDFANDCTDANIIRFVFITSDNAAFDFLKQRGAWSRAELPPIEIDDLSDSEAVQYLQQRYKLDSEQATKTVSELAGGKFFLLDRLADQLHKQQHYSEVKRQALVVARLEYKSAGLLTEGQVRMFGGRLAKSILSSPTRSISSAQLDRLVPSMEMQENLLTSEVFKLHVSRDVVTFKNRLVQTFAEEGFASGELKD